MARIPINQFLSTDLNGGGTFSFVGDYSGGSAIQPGIEADARHRIYMRRMIITVRDSAMTASKFGGLAELTNGVSFYMQPTAGGDINSISSIPIKSNAEWGRYTYDASIDNTGSGDDFLLVRWSFDKAYGPEDGFDGVILHPGYSLRMSLSDDLTGLDDFTVLVQGRRERLKL